MRHWGLPPKRPCRFCVIWTPVRFLPSAQHSQLSKTVTTVTIGPVVTIHQKYGARHVSTPSPSDRIKQISAGLADLPQEAVKETKDRLAIESEVADLKCQIARAKQSSPKQPETQRITSERAIISHKDLEYLKQATRSLREHGEAINRALQHIAQRLEDLARGHDIQRRPPMSTPADTRTADVHNGLTGPQQRIVDAVAWFEAIGIKAPEHTALAFVAGYTVGGGAFNNPRGRLRSMGLIEYHGTKMALTDAGRAMAETPEAPLTDNALHKRVLERLPGPERKLLQELIKVYPNHLSDADLAAKTWYTIGGGAFNNPKGRLRTIGLVHYHAAKRVRAADILFPNSHTDGGS